MSNDIITERADLFEPNINIVMVADIIGLTSDEILIESVKKAFEVNEALHSRIILDTSGKAWYEKSFTRENTVYVSDKPWQEIQKEQEKIPFRIWEGELIRVFLLHVGRIIRLLVIAHHLAGDGKSIVYFIEDIMRGLNGEVLEYKPLRLIYPQELPAKSKLPWYVRLLTMSYHRKWLQNARVFQFTDYQRMFTQYWNQRSSIIYLEHFDKDELNKLHQHAKQAGVTINSFIATAFLYAYQKNADIGVAVDIREDQNRNMGNQTTGISINYGYAENKSFEENAREVQSRIRKKISNDYHKHFILQFIAAMDGTLIDSAYMKLYGDYHNKISGRFAELMQYSGNSKDFGITNLTRLDIPNQYGRYRLENFLFIPPIMSYVKRVVGVATLGDEMNITYHILKENDCDMELAMFKRAISCLRDTGSQ
ncbi:hypothetical protein H0486_15165 [Lachnospiraceae bacterium MD1]|uniref:Condensation domain-containing protein n=1 Tax=Variimorphobacter saccharofermentans TaxID=2755051 RepID=A0A839K4B9_9FIRM|nr:hypothetical protein [Variimorphobacter saccharofermentans]MBB2184218.1 hypothetical protein [Variimorphobacter saccharofermentans]